MLVSCNTGVITDATNWNSLTFNATNPSSIYAGAAARLRRVVSAVLNVSVLTPPISRQGILSVCYLPYTGTTGNMTNDTLRDQPETVTVNISSVPNARCVWKPYDPDYFTFQPVGSAIGTTVPALTFSISGAVPNAQVMVSFRVVHEMIPVAGSTDLLMPTTGPIGSPNDVVEAFRSVEATGSLSFGDQALSVARSVGNRLVRATSRVSRELLDTASRVAINRASGMQIPRRPRLPPISPDL